MTKDDHLIFEKFLKPRLKTGDFVIPNTLDTRANGIIPDTLYRVEQIFDMGYTVVDNSDVSIYLYNTEIDWNKTAELNKKFKPEDKETAADLLDI
jgi:hypothetical protein